MSLQDIGLIIVALARVKTIVVWGEITVHHPLLHRNGIQQYALGQSSTEICVGAIAASPSCMSTRSRRLGRRRCYARRFRSIPSRKTGKVDFRGELRVNLAIFHLLREP